MFIILFQGISIVEFSQKFQTEQDCLQFLSKIKWQNGFCCSKCGNKNYCKGKKEFARRCTRCKYEESVTNGTLFHKLKFPIVKAFYIIFLINMTKNEISSADLSEKLSLSQPTCWLFKKKVIHAIKKSGKANFQKGFILIDELIIGGFKKEIKSTSNRKGTVVGVRHKASKG